MQMFKVWQRVVLHYPNERAADRCGLQISDKEGCCKCHSIRAATYVSSNLYALSILQHLLSNILKLNLQIYTCAAIIDLYTFLPYDRGK